MKLILIFVSFSFLLLGCNPESTPKTQPGDERGINPIVVDRTSRLYADLQNVCGALEEKERDLDDYVGRVHLEAKYQESDCNGKLGKASLHDLMVYRRNSRYEFQNEDNNFGLPEVESLQSGVMKEICTALAMSRLENPVRMGSQTVIEFKGTETSHCKNTGREVCLQIIRGRASAAGDTYSVSESTLISFRIARGDRPGFYSYKQVKTYGSCGGNKFRTKIVTF